MEHGADFAKIANGYAKQLDDLQGVVLFTELRYRGVRVYPDAWHAQSEEPLLACSMMYWDADEAGWSLEDMRADGWDFVDPRNGATKHVHVDDLEKIEGPPPEGAF